VLASVAAQAKSPNRVKKASGGKGGRSGAGAGGRKESAGQRGKRNGKVFNGGSNSGKDVLARLRADLEQQTTRNAELQVDVSKGEDALAETRRRADDAEREGRKKGQEIEKMRGSKNNGPRLSARKRTASRKAAEGASDDESESEGERERKEKEEKETRKKRGISIYR
jgi:hypothetical protein